AAAFEPFGDVLLRQLERLALRGRVIVREHRQARGPAGAERRRYRDGAERFVPANDAVVSLLVKRLPDVETVDVAGDPCDAAFAGREKPVESDVRRANGRNGEESMRRAERGCNLARDFGVAAVLLGAIRTSPRNRSDTALTQQAEKAAAVPPSR